ncbi:MAG: carbohydrate kinase family protein [Bryobacteraceae bacterium]
MHTEPDGVLCCGNVVLDILVRPVVEPGWGKTTWVEAIEQQLGGNGANTSYTLALLGVPARLLSAVGEDAFGERALALLTSAGVETRRITRSTEPTPSTVVLIRPDGARALLHRPGASLQAFASPIELAPGLIDGCSRFHLANVFALPKLQPYAADLLRRARMAGLSTSLDTGWDAQGRWMASLGECLQYIDLLFVNQDEARQLSGVGDPEQAARILQDQGARDVIVKLGADGCLVAAAKEHFWAGAFRVPVVDTTGAGDCFAGGFLAALQRAFNYQDAARFANAVGALSVQALGGVTGLRTFEQTLEWMHQFQSSG